MFTPSPLYAEILKWLIYHCISSSIILQIISEYLPCATPSTCYIKKNTSFYFQMFLMGYTDKNKNSK